MPSGPLRYRQNIQIKDRWRHVHAPAALKLLESRNVQELTTARPRKLPARCLHLGTLGGRILLLVAAALFSIGLAVVLTKRHAVVVLMGIELMLNAVNLNLVAFSQYDPDRLQGQLFSLFVIVVAAAEAAVALSLVIQVYRHFRTVRLDELTDLKQ